MLTEFLLLAISSFVALCGDSFWIMWIGIELFSFIIFPWLIDKEHKLAKMEIFLYFLIQFLGSALFLISVFAKISVYFDTLAYVSMLMKLACFPFHSWLIEVIQTMSWKKIVVLLTLSKMAPLGIMYFLTPTKYLIWILIFGLTTPLGGLRTTCLRTLMGYSSVGHSSWLILSLYSGKLLMFSYLFTYWVCVVFICNYFKKNNLLNIKSAFSLSSSMAPFIALLSISGLPPFIGFFPKLFVIMTFCSFNAYLEAVFMGLSSLVPLYFYFKMCLFNLFGDMSTRFLFKQQEFNTLMFVFVLGVVPCLGFILSSFSL